MTGKTGSLSGTFRDISCKGAEVVVDANAEHRLIPGTQVQVSFDLDDASIEVPARVVWAGKDVAGLRFHFGETSEANKKAYAQWIVPRTNVEIRKALALA
jgi:hypothetical protein